MTTLNARSIVGRPGTTKPTTPTTPTTPTKPEDDCPTCGQGPAAPVIKATVPVIVDEDGLGSSANRDSTPLRPGEVKYTDSATATGKISVAFGNTEPGLALNAIKLSLSGLPSDLVTSDDGATVVWSLSSDGRTITGKAGNEPVITIAVTSAQGYQGTGNVDYTYKVTLHQAVQHAEPTGGQLSYENLLDLPVKFTVTNSVRVSSQSTFTVQVADDSPYARDDVANVVVGNYEAVVGNVISNDTVGADTATVQGIKSTNVDGNQPVDKGNGVLEIKGQYGTLTIEPNGAYSYVRDYNTPGGRNDVFVYDLTDADGDTSKAKLTVKIADATPVVNSVASVSVDEDDLPARNGEPEGTDGSDPVETAPTRITFQSWDGVKELWVGRDGSVDPADVVNLFDNGVFIEGQSLENDHGVLTFINGTWDQTTGEGHVDYVYTLKDNVDHDDANGENHFSENYVVRLVDLDNDIPASLPKFTVTVVDDVPVALDDTDFIATGEWKEEGNVITGVDTTSGDDGKDEKGADDADVTAIRSLDNEDAVPTQDGEWFVVKGKYGTLEIKADGDYVYTRDQGTSGGVSERFEYTLTDRDGDPAKATLTIEIEDGIVTVDVPEASTNPEDPDVPGTVVYEKGLAARPNEPEGSGYPEEGDLASTTAKVSFKAFDGLTKVAILVGGVEVIDVRNLANGDTYNDGTRGQLKITNYTYDPETGEGSFDYTYTLLDNEVVEGDSTEFKFDVTVVDNDELPPEDNRDSDTKTVTIKIIDDAPLAVADFDKVEGGTTTTTGNVIAGEVENEVVGVGGPDTVGADGATVVRVVNEEVQSDEKIDQTGDETEVAGEWGTLYIKANGDYRYVRNTEGDNIPENGAQDVFTYTLQDADGDEVTTTLTIEIENRPVELTLIAPTQVDEAGLPGNRETILGDGSEGTGEAADPNEDDNSEYAEGQVKFTAPDGLPSEGVVVRIGDTNITLAQLQAATSASPIIVQGTYGELAITGFTGPVGDDDEYTISYVYELVQNTDQDDDPEDTFAFTVYDADGSSTTGDLVIAIIDDEPQPQNDIVTLVSGVKTVDGNVIAGTIVGGDEVGAIAPGAADLPGADGPVKVVAIDSETEDEKVVAEGETGTVIEGTYGTLTIRQDGSYSYERTSGTGERTDIFTYTVEDADGSTSTAELRITSTNSGVTVNSVPAPGDSGTIVYEAALGKRDDGDEGSQEAENQDDDNDDPREVTTGTVAFTAPDGVDSIKFGDTTFELSELETAAPENPLAVPTTDGFSKFEIIGYTFNEETGAGTFTYRYTLLDDIEHVNGADETVNFEFTITDTDGDESEPGTITIAIVDDKPEASDDIVDINPGGKEISGNVIDGTVDEDQGEIEDGAGDLTGADGAKVTHVTLPGEETPRPVPEQGLVVTDQDEYEITIYPNGNYEYTRKDGVTGDKEHTFTYTLTDEDGSVTTADLVIKSSSSPAQILERGSVELDEDGFPFANVDSVPPASNEADKEENLTATSNIVVKFGETASDLPTNLGGSIAFGTTNFPTTLKSNGQSVTNWDATTTPGVLVGRLADGTPVITITLNSTPPTSVNGTVTYSYTATLNQPIDHDTVDVEDSFEFNIPFVITSGDGSPTSGTFSVTVWDDVPTIEASFGEDDPSVNPGGTISGALDYVPGADGLEELVVLVNGVEHVVDPADPVIDLENGATLTITLPAGGNPGSWTFTAPQSVPGDDNLSYNISFKITDNDGDTDTTELSSSIIVVRPPNPGTLIVGSNVGDGGDDGQQWVVGDGSGTIRGEALDDLLVGDQGGLLPPTGRNAQIALVLDVSHSMNELIEFDGRPDVSRLAALKEATIALINKLVQPDGTGNIANSVTLHLIPFASIAGEGRNFQLVTEGGQVNAAAVAEATNWVNGLTAGGEDYALGQLGNETNYEAGFLKANELLTNSGHIKKVLFISDGAPNLAVFDDGNPQEPNDVTSLMDSETALGQVLGTDGSNELQLIRNKGYTVDAIGINVGPTEKALLDKLTTGGAHNIVDGEGLEQIVTGLGGAEALAGAGGDLIEGGAGNDIIFGDVLYTDDVYADLGLQPSGLSRGIGWEVFAKLEADGTVTAYSGGQPWQREDTENYIREHHRELGRESGRSGGNDNIKGGDGSDIIYGQEGNDVIDGGAGNDIIAGGSGRDTLTGGAGADTFVFAHVGNSNKDTITDYSFDEGDKIDLTALLTGHVAGDADFLDHVTLTLNGTVATLSIVGITGGSGVVADLEAVAAGDKVQLVVGSHTYDWELTV